LLRPANEDKPALTMADDWLTPDRRVRRRIIMAFGFAMLCGQASAALSTLAVGSRRATMRDAIMKAIKEKARRIVVGSGSAAVELLRVEPGTFNLGSPNNEDGRQPNEGPVRRVTLTRAFYLGTTAITQRQYTAVTGRLAAKPAGPEVAIDQLT